MEFSLHEAVRQVKKSRFADSEIAEVLRQVELA